MKSRSMVFAMVLVMPTVSLAQQGDPSDNQVRVGSRVRILSPVLGEKRQTGSVTDVKGDTLLFRPGRSAEDRRVLTSEITRIEIPSGTHTSKLKGALIGVLVGGGAGAVLGAATWQKPAPCEILCFDNTRSDDAVLGGILGGLIGALTGTFIGARQTETWVPAVVTTRTVGSQ